MNDEEQNGFTRYNKYLVIKREDIDKYVSKDQNPLLDWKAVFWDAVNRIEIGRNKDDKRINNYVVVNEDEPYSEDVWMLIEKGKSLNNLGYLSPEQVRERERKLLLKIEQTFMWGQVPYITTSGKFQEWTMHCISEKDWQALKEETDKES